MVDLGWDPLLGSHVVKVTEKWIVSVTPMIFNDRVVLTALEDYPLFYAAGWCYDKGGAAALAALAWDPEAEHEPAGYKKAAVPRAKEGAK